MTVTSTETETETLPSSLITVPCTTGTATVTGKAKRVTTTLTTAFPDVTKHVLDVEASTTTLACMPSGGLHGRSAKDAKRVQLRYRRDQGSVLYETPNCGSVTPTTM